MFDQSHFCVSSSCHVVVFCGSTRGRTDSWRSSLASSCTPQGPLQSGEPASVTCHCVAERETSLSWWPSLVLGILLGAIGAALALWRVRILSVTMVSRILSHPRGGPSTPLSSTHNLKKRVRPPTTRTSTCAVLVGRGPRGSWRSQRTASTLLSDGDLRRSSVFWTQLEINALVVVEDPAHPTSGGILEKSDVIIDAGDVPICDAVRGHLRRKGKTLATAAWLPDRRSHLPGAAAASEDDYDLRTLPVHVDLCGTRARSFPDAVGAMLEDALPDFPIQGPRAARWLLLELARGGLWRVARHHGWRQMLNDTNRDPGVDEHIFLWELLQYATCYDQLNCPNLPCTEASAKRLQLWEQPLAGALERRTPLNEISFGAVLGLRGWHWWPGTLV